MSMPLEIYELILSFCDELTQERSQIVCRMFLGFEHNNDWLMSSAALVAEANREDILIARYKNLFKYDIFNTTNLENQGNMRNLSRFINRMILYACRYGFTNLVNIMDMDYLMSIELCNSDSWIDGYLNACNHNNILVETAIRLFTDYNSTDCNLTQNDLCTNIECSICRRRSRCRHKCLLEEGLFKACVYGNIDTVKFMINMGAKHIGNYINEVFMSGNVDLIAFVMTLDNSGEILYGIDKSLLVGVGMNAGKILIELGYGDLNDGLYSACRLGDITYLNYVIEQGANDWNIGLIGACMNDQVELAKLMIDKGANDWNGTLDEAIDANSFQIILLMLERIPMDLVYDVCEENIEFMISLMEYDVDLNKLLARFDHDYWTDALCLACRRGNIRIITLIMSMGAKVSNETLHDACESGNIDVVNLIMPLCQAPDINECLAASCCSGNSKLINLFIEKGANEWTVAFEYALLGGHRRVMKQMLDLGAQPSDLMALYDNGDAFMIAYVRHSEVK